MSAPTPCCPGQCAHRGSWLDGGGEDVHGALKAKLRDHFPRPASVEAVIVIVTGDGLLNGLLAVFEGVEGRKVLFQLVMLLGIRAGVRIDF